MRIAVIADIHANAAAFDAVRQTWGDVDEVWCLGDIVGYGPDPNECIERLRALPHRCVVGNHDLAALGRIDTSDFNPDARAAAEWTADHLSAQSRAYLEALDQTLVVAPFTIVHGSPRSPVWEYLLDVPAAEASFALMATDLCLVGHSHVPLMFTQESGGQTKAQLLAPIGPVDLDGARRILNPGSVGQPRDGDPRASYAIVEVDRNGAATFDLRRVPYDMEKTQNRMAVVGLPPSVARRLELGR